MSHLKLPFVGLLAASTLVCNISAALVTPQVDYSLGEAGPTHSVWFSSSTDAPLGGAAYLFYGTFSNIGSITATSTAQEIEDDFNQLGLSPAGDLDVYALAGTFSSDVEDTDFEGQRGYLIAANNADIGLATEVAIVSNSELGGWMFDDPISPLLPESITSNDYSTQAAGADIVLGSYGAGGSGFESIQMVALVPEPSSLSLLGLGTAVFLFRRKK